MVHTIMVRNIMKVSYRLLIGAVLGLVLSCTSKTSPIPDCPLKEIRSEYDPMSHTHSSIKEDFETTSTNIQSSPRHSKKISLDISVNHYYDEGYNQGQEDGYNDGIENLRGDSYDDSCHYRGKKKNEYELGYEEGYEAGFDDGFADSGLDPEYEE